LANLAIQATETNKSDLIWIKATGIDYFRGRLVVDYFVNQLPCWRNFTWH